MASKDRKGTAIIADDIQLMREMLKKILEMNGFSVVAEVNDGYEAVQAYAKHQPDLIFMDIVMPNKNGIEATKEIIALNPDARIVVCSSMDNEGLCKAASEAGAFGIVCKPFKMKQMENLLRTVSLYIS
jgi:two-component system chemotaxis response regulator CheY